MTLNPVPPFDLEKSYPSRGPLQQFRLRESLAFYCFRCGTTKKSRLVTVYNGDWDSKLCNGCYGRLLSLYEIRAGTGTEDEKADALAQVLSSALSKDQVKEAERLLKLADKRAEYLSDKALRFVATAEYVSASLGTNISLEWSPAIIGLCKAVEVEIIQRLVDPLKASLSAIQLAADLKDKDFSRVARYVTDPSAKPPELGTFAHFLQTALNSRGRQATSSLIQGFISHTKSWPLGDWIRDPEGLYKQLVLLTGEYRNRAAHTDELNEADYAACRALVIGEHGIMWRLLLATQLHSQKPLDKRI